MSKPASLSERDALETAQEAQLALRLLLARIDTVENTVVCPELLPEASKLFRVSANRAALAHKKLYKDALEATKSREKRTLTANADVSLEVGDFFGHFTFSIRTSNFSSASLNLSPAKASSYLTILAFAPKDSTSVRYVSLQEEQNRRDNQILSEEHGSKIESSSKEICLHVKFWNVKWLYSTFCNLRFCYAALVGEASFDSSLLGLMVSDLMEQTQDPGFIKLAEACSDMPEFFYNVLTILDEYLLQLAKVASKSSLQTALLEDSPISPSFFKNFTAPMRAELTAHLRTAIMRSNPHPAMSTIPASMKFLFPKLVGVAPPAPDHTKRRAPEDVSLPIRANKAQRTGANAGNSAPSQTTGNTGPATKGFLLWSGEKAPRHLNVLYTASGGDKEERLCVYFVCRGLVCRKRDTCKQHHPTSFDRIPTAAQESLAKVVQSTTGLSFAPGQGPAGDCSPSVLSFSTLRKGQPQASSTLDFSRPPSPTLCTGSPPVPDPTSRLSLFEANTISDDCNFLAYPKVSAIVTPKPPPYALRWGEPTVTTDLSQPPQVGHAVIANPLGDLVTCAASLPTLRNSYSKAEREQFINKHANKHVLAHLNSPFGKNRSDISFACEPRLRHVLLPLFFSQFLDDMDVSSLCRGIDEAKILFALLESHQDVDFNPLRVFPTPGALSETEINADRVKMLTAALLFFEGSVASLVRWMQGAHVGAHRDPAMILSRWKTVWRADTSSHLARIWHRGCPNKIINATSSERNFKSFFHYGNHKSFSSDTDKSMKALVKDFRRSLVLVFDPRMVYFMLHCHLNPMGMVDLTHRTKNPRPVVDSSFRPLPDSICVNDFTSKTTEPPLEFATAFFRSLIWLYNMRISYPNEEIYLGDDDVSGAFRWPKYHPDAVAMHSSLQNGYLVSNTGLSFGGETSPANWEPHANARQQTARHIWHHPAIETIAQPFIPPIEIAPTPADTRFTPAESDACNPGVFRPDGSRLPPLFCHHVDDEYYAEVKQELRRTLSASVLALYEVVGYPTKDILPSLSFDKLVTKYNHLRKWNGFMVDSRRMIVDICPEKRSDAIVDLKLFRALPSFTLPQAAQVVGTIESLSKFSRWGRAYFFALQNYIRAAITSRYHLALRLLQKSGKRRHYEAVLPSHLRYRVDHLVSKDISNYIWCTRTTTKPTRAIHCCVDALLSLLEDTAVDWSSPLASIVPRAAHAVSAGDASHDGGGGHCTVLEYWFDVAWSDATRKRTRLSQTHPEYIHINSLEFLVIVLQLAAFIVRMQSAETDPRVARWFPGTASCPHFPILLCLTDNTASKAWARKVTSKSSMGQRLLEIYALFLRHFHFGINAVHIPGVDNIVADFISRPTHFHLSHSARSKQIFHKHPSLTTFCYFLPSPELLQLLSSALSTKPAVGPPSLPASLGRFVPAGSTILSSPTL